MKNIKKCFMLVLACILAISLLTGCNKVYKAHDYDNEMTDWTFTFIASGSRMSIYKEDITDVMYVVYHDGYNGGMTVMMNEDGTPLLYSEWAKMLN